LIKALFILIIPVIIFSLLLFLASSHAKNWCHC